MGYKNKSLENQNQAENWHMQSELLAYHSNNNHHQSSQFQLKNRIKKASVGRASVGVPPTYK